MKKHSTRILLGLAPLALVVSLTALPGTAEARIICREGWHGDRCVQTNHWHNNYRVGDYYRDRFIYAPRAHWVRYGEPRHGYRYIEGPRGNVILIDGHRRIVRVY